MFPKTGNKRPYPHSETDFAMLIARALNTELGSTHRAVKTVMRWTGASERTAKHWLAGTHAPDGAHLIGLVRHSDEVLGDFLRAAGRGDVVLAVGLVDLRSRLLEMVELIDRQGISG
ncbi:MAG: hypothetical protein WC816_01445 [Sphingomonas sp.]|jgi:hypothetical protein